MQPVWTRLSGFSKHNYKKSKSFLERRLTMINPNAIEEFYRVRKDCKYRELNRDSDPKEAYRQCEVCKRAMQKLSEDPSALDFFIGDH
jgi:hypothetical protein